MELTVVMIMLMEMMMMLVIMMMMIMMILSATNPIQLGVDESLTHGVGDRGQWEHRPRY